MRPCDAFGRVVSCRQVLLLLLLTSNDDDDDAVSEPAAQVDHDLLCRRDAGKLWVAARWTMRAGR